MPSLGSWQWLCRRAPRTALALSRSHPSDEKEFSFPRNISAGSLGSLLVHHHSTNHVAEGSEPAVTEPLIAGHAGEHDTRIDVEREVGARAPALPVPWGRALTPVPTLSLQREVLTPTPPAGITRSKSKHELKLLEKIPDNAEATVVLVGMEAWAGQECGRRMPGTLVTPVPPVPARLCGVPGPAHHGLRAAAGGRGAGRGAGGARTCAVPLRAAGPQQHPHGLPRDRALHLHPHVRQGPCPGARGALAVPC